MYVLFWLVIRYVFEIIDFLEFLLFSVRFAISGFNGTRFKCILGKDGNRLARDKRARVNGASEVLVNDAHVVLQSERKSERKAHGCKNENERGELEIRSERDFWHFLYEYVFCQTNQPKREKCQKRTERRKEKEDYRKNAHPTKFHKSEQHTLESSFFEGFERKEKPGEHLVLRVTL